MTTSITEVDSFRLLRTSLRKDLVSFHGFPNPDAGAILNTFDPSNPEYLANVDSWQRLLCSGVSTRPFNRVTSPVGEGLYGLCGSIDEVRTIHQIAKLFYKWHGLPRKETDWVAVKNRLSQPLPITLDDRELEGIRYQLRKLVAPDLYDVIGRFGPGCTAEGFDPYEKWSRLGQIPNVPASLFRCSFRDPKSFTLSECGRTKIAEVPKSIKCNRIVSSEPAMYMFAQLGVADSLVEQLHTHYGKYVSLDNQERHNEALMWDGACSIDLSDASDHVNCDLVQAVLPQLWPVLARVRSSYACFPDGEEVPLRTFAPMGSGVCFPVLTAVVLGICLYVLERHRSAKYCSAVSLWAHVYGDDVIVPRWIYDDVVDLLAKAGLVVNHSKSCYLEDYRESCGKEIFMGVDITPCYIRDPLITVDADKVEQVAQILSERFFPSTATMVLDTAAAAKAVRYNYDLQRLELLARVQTARQKVSALDGWDGLNRWYSIHTQGNTWYEKSHPEGVGREVWTKPGWRYKASGDFPYLSTWLVTRVKTHNPSKQPTKTKPLVP